MINVFKRLAPAYGRIVRQFALDVWYGRSDLREFYASAERYRRRYERELIQHYRRLGYPFRADQIRHEGDLWLSDQLAIAQKVGSVAAKKKDGLAQKFDDLIAEKQVEVKALLAGALKPEGRVAQVVAFSNNFEAKALQIGEEAAWDLAREINHSVVSGMGEVYRWKTQGDERVRKTHRMLGGKLFDYRDPPTTIDEHGHRHTGNPGTDWGCVPSGTRIRLNSDVVRCFRRKFRGELSSIVTESGMMVSATGNHPVLTQAGWKPANLVNVGDYVFKVPDKNFKSTESDIYDTGAPVEKVFDFFSLCGNKIGVSQTATQFHGDGIPEEEVDIVTVDWELTDKRNPFSGDKIRKLVFANPDVVPFHLLGSGQSELDPLLFWLGLSSFGNVGSFRNFHSLFGSGVLKADDIGLASIPRSYAFRFDEPPYEGSHPTVPEILDRTSETTHAIPVVFNDLVMERVVFVEKVPFDGHVYNLETSANWYIANGLSIHNCRCVEEPAKGRPLRGYIANAQRKTA